MKENFASKTTETIVTMARVLAKVQDRSVVSVLYRAGAYPGMYSRLIQGGDIHAAKAEALLANMRAKWPPGMPLPDGYEPEQEETS